MLNKKNENDDFKKLFYESVKVLNTTLSPKKKKFRIGTLFVYDFAFFNHADLSSSLTLTHFKHAFFFNLIALFSSSLCHFPLIACQNNKKKKCIMHDTFHGPRVSTEIIDQRSLILQTSA